MRDHKGPAIGATHAARRTDLFAIPASPVASSGLTLVRPTGRKPGERGPGEVPRAKRPGLY